MARDSVRTIVIVALAVGWHLLAATAANAFQTKAHLWIAEAVLADVKAGCSTRPDAEYCVTLEVCVDRDPADSDLVRPWSRDAPCFLREYAVEAGLGRALVKEHEAYRAGHLGPDTFPDLIVGQFAAHPGLDGGWQADDWLEWLLRHAETDEERAFALGWAGHMAGDVFGHTWVNAYAGGTFVLGDGEQTTERRHFAVEAYADRFVPDFDATIFSPPADFVARRLVLDEGVAAQLHHPGAGGPHLLAMFGVHRALGEAEKVLASAPALQVEDRLYDLRHRLHENAIELHRLADPKVAAQGALEAAQEVLRQHERLISSQERLVAQAREAVEDLLRRKAEAERLVADAPRRIDRLEDEIRRQEKTLESTRRWVEYQVTNRVCETAPWPVSEICRKVTETKRKIDGEWQRLKDSIDGKRRDVRGLRDRLRQAHEDVVAIPKRRAEQDAVRIAAEAEFARLWIARDADRNGREALETAQRKLMEVHAREMELLERAERLHREIDPLTGPAGGLRGLRQYLKEWRADVERGVAAYVEAGEDSARAFLAESDPLEPYQEWLECWGPAFSGVPSPVARAHCAALHTVKEFREQISAFRADVHEHLGETGGWLLDPAFKVEQEVEKRLAPALEQAAIDVAGFVAGPETQALAELIRFEASSDAVDDLFSKDQSGRKLLLIPDASERLRRDMAVANGSLSATDFYALRNAVVLTKLTLLAPQELNRLAADCGVWPSTLYGDRLFPSVRNYNILSDAIRSLDGDHQWNPHAPRRLRREGYRDESSRRSRTFGYEAPKGFRLWQSRRARVLVFHGIFRGPITPGLLDLIPTGHEYRPSEQNPFPEIEGD